VVVGARWRWERDCEVRPTPPALLPWGKGLGMRLGSGAGVKK